MASYRLRTESLRRIAPQCVLATLVLCGVLASITCVRAQSEQSATQSSASTDEQRQRESHIEFFETKIRPALVEHCLDCHASDSEASGGLLLDSRNGWLEGGDLGAAIVPGDAESSRLYRAITYDDPELQMPPDGQLPADVVDAFRKWISDGAVDPRNQISAQGKPQTGLPVERAQEHWAYRPLDAAHQTMAATGSSTTIDNIINSKLESQGLSALPRAPDEVLVRRTYVNLTGLPPTPQQVEAFVNSTEPNKLQQLSDQLLGTVAFGEQFARNWLDVVRFAESITLRGFVLPEAWRYRDYVIKAFTEDRPFDQMIVEQLAGDLLSSADISERQQQLVATGFLALGNTNLEQQDKSQLEMDYIDEQLEVIGRAFLGQTIGCARCHDHKFDPIPAHDYYAMAGILKSATAMEHDNVSKWIERPLPLEPNEQARYDSMAKQRSEITAKIKRAKQSLGGLAKDDRRLVPIAEFPGVIVDSADAELVGDWTHSTFFNRSIGDGYIHDGNEGQGEKSATFTPPPLASGEYEVRLAYGHGSNRSSRVSVRVFSSDGEKQVLLNQRKPTEDDEFWVSLGKFRFEPDGQAYVLVSNEDTNGHVVLDAVQFLAEGDRDERRPMADQVDNAAEKLELETRLKQLESELKKLDAALAKQPRYLTLVEEGEPLDIAIHIRGSVHSLGPVVPRGFLTAVEPTSLSGSESSGSEFSGGEFSGGESSGSASTGEPPTRLELARWIADRDNPLTARVYANRVWSWLMGQGVVETVNNFGTTGLPPSNEALLDHLAQELIASGWSTHHLVRLICASDAYARHSRSVGGTTASVTLEANETLDPRNQFYWRGHLGRLSVEQMRDAMLLISGELDCSVGGSLIPASTNSDYNFAHQTTRRSIYHPVFRNSLPELYEAFDFANASVSVGKRSRSTVATQSLVLMNHPWVSARAKAAAAKFARELESSTLETQIAKIYRSSLGREPTPSELQLSVAFLTAEDSATESPTRLEQLVHSLFASLDFRYLE